VDILAQLARSRPAIEAAAEPAVEVDEAEREAGIEQVMREIIDDPDASFRTDAVLYQDFLVRCRIRRVPGNPLSLSAFRRRYA
ncbi:ATP-binding protein, partial [Rhizobiaceae sp. 2RAB30]